MIIMISLILLASGFVIVNRYYKKLSLIENIMFTISLSLAVAILLGLLLAYTGTFNIVIFLITYFVIVLSIFALSFLKK